MSSKFTNNQESSPVEEKPTNPKLINAAKIAMLGLLVIIPGALGQVTLLPDYTESLGNGGRDIHDLSEQLEKVYANQVDIVYQATDDDSQGTTSRPTLVYIDKTLREDCKVIKQLSDTPEIVCGSDPQPVIK